MILFVFWFSLSESRAMTLYLEGQDKLICQGKNPTLANPPSSLLWVSLVEMHTLQGQEERGDLTV